MCRSFVGQSSQRVLIAVSALLVVLKAHKLMFAGPGDATLTATCSSPSLTKNLPASRQQHGIWMCPGRGAGTSRTQDTCSAFGFRQRHSRVPCLLYRDGGDTYRGLDLED